VTRIRTDLSRWTLVAAGILITCNMWAQTVPVRNWAAPLYWQPSEKESSILKRTGEGRATAASTLSPNSQSASASASVPLVFVAITPCRMLDTRGSDPTFTGVYGPPALSSGGTLTVPVAGVTAGQCALPGTAQAVSTNVTLLPNPGAQVRWLTLWPAGQSMPSVSTINDYQGTLFSPANGISIYGINDAAIVPDIGILASADPVALDHACYDLVNAAPVNKGSAADGHAQADVFQAVHPGIDGRLGLAYAESIGLGNRDYELVRA